MDELVKLIGNVGFPIAVSAFLLVRIENQLDLMNQTLVKLIEYLPKSTT